MMTIFLKTWMTCFFFKVFLSFFKQHIPCGISITNHHLLIINNHRSHVILELIEQTQAFGLNMMTLSSHTSHALQPLDVACFKPFTTTFRKEKNEAMASINYTKANKIILAT
jgi:hypothetical protein